MLQSVLAYAPAFAQPDPGSAIGLSWLIPVVPAISAAVLLLVGKRLGQAASGVAITAMGFSAVASTFVFIELLGAPADERSFVMTVTTWIAAGDFAVDWAVLVDPLSAVMLLLVTWVGLLIHIYSVGYMRGDELYPRFFAYLNLFAASMLVLVLGESLLTLFVGWELVGLSSYLLIGFWFKKRDYASAAKKAFVLNRIGDVGFMIAMFVIFSAIGSLSFTEVLPQADTLATGTAAVVGLLFLLAAAGKSAQIPLYVWLPDAMAGPTPVSALIHAATMVTAGVYLVARVSPIYVQVPEVGMAVAWVGILTALLAALIACAQRDLKKILAYSTVSQLGYMFVGVGLGAQVAGIFHLLTHGFFKALLFLAAGSVMHAMHEHTDVWKMGGLRTIMPITFGTSLIGWLAISGVPPFAGFFSKEEILVAALDTPGAQGIWILGTIVAGLTAFYMSRWFFLIFFGEKRYERELPDVHPHESEPAMTLPLVVLAVASALGGLLNVTPRSLAVFWAPEAAFLDGWLAGSVMPYAGDVPFVPHVPAVFIVTGVAVLGILTAAALYLRPVDHTVVRERLGGFYWLAHDKFYVDELYINTIVKPGKVLSDGFAAFDRYVIDGIVNGLGRGTAVVASVGRRAQTGFVRSYALAVTAGTILVAVLFAGGFFFGQGA
ncbi:NADH-quinone oxidoreductase subunit L [Egibacter rhizosphaerae]|uniref:NADH-quinone oxidoreductase subunit L n=1 Tax=Egibacter rhizosphaerae TaxID=1670831 RepID=A0A411YGM1_9ACTN|nr:NADH-quinone oxidoreductase subunit L [Egibacter rhizosphaerae]QBI20368.1 NADH-quinone oxidoreductase subunit L [Egibacter rhizosphaerae]